MTMMTKTRPSAIGRSLRALATACTALLLGTTAHAQALEVTTSFSILGDLVAQVGGERVAVRTLVGADEDAHAFQPRPSDAREIGSAALVVVNGLGFDDWMVRLARAGGYKGKVVVASEGIATLTMAKNDGHGHGHNHGHGGKAVDPHAWQDVTNVRRYVANIADALAQADPQGAAVYRLNAERYDGELKALDAEIRAAFDALPAERRKVVSSHDAFGYFGRAYGLRFLSPVGVASNAEPTAQGVARLIRQIKADNVPAVFIENVADPRLIERIRSESGAQVGGTLYSDALSKADGPASSYIQMMRSNLDVLRTALAAPADR
ncbi:MAG TPA: zinc ABC transporter substrate-binding protein [Thauera sp.]|uniref:metal ABC transporter solute-binding protein, Zn/Mn family n=1 Tax=Thauera sp. TaxID=1905334 RepID=UPI002CB7562F|nr:zinc ABC transporter substrate-binding protein [Thauera sp.]HRP22774.1 zinc ABC transporter substrate-binding protein [Thauera sp.]HRP66638.1 zinc ABC transporter substrate-binding protein [Thauera sp.]